MTKRATTDQVLDAVVSLAAATGEMETRLTRRIDNVEMSLTRRIDNFEMSLTRRIDQMDRRFDQIDARLISVESSAR